MTWTFVAAALVPALAGPIGAARDRGATAAQRAWTAVATLAVPVACLVAPHRVAGRLAQGRAAAAAAARRRKLDRHKDDLYPLW